MWLEKEKGGKKKRCIVEALGWVLLEMTYFFSFFFSSLSERNLE